MGHRPDELHRAKDPAYWLQYNTGRTKLMRSRVMRLDVHIGLRSLFRGLWRSLMNIIGQLYASALTFWNWYDMVLRMVSQRRTRKEAPRTAGG